MADDTLEAIAEPEAPDALRRPMLDALQTELGVDLLAYELIDGDDLIVRVDRKAWRRAVALCKERLGLTYFCFLAGIDWMPNPDLLGEKAWEAEEAVIEATEEAIETAAGDDDAAGVDAAEADKAADEAPKPKTSPYAKGVAGGDTRFQVFARLYNLVTHVGITLKADLDEAQPRVDSLVSLYRGADWHEREAWEMYGFDFTGHPGLRHLYLPSEFEGYPLRKDFPLLARIVKPWPGLVDVEPMPGEEVDPNADPLAAGDEG